VKTETIVDLGDLEKIGIECAKCHTETILNAAVGDASLIVLSQNCPSCAKEFNGLAELIQGYVAAVRKLRSNPHRHKITLRISRYIPFSMSAPATEPLPRP